MKTWQEDVRELNRIFQQSAVNIVVSALIADTLTDLQIVEISKAYKKAFDDTPIQDVINEYRGV